MNSEYKIVEAEAVDKPREGFRRDTCAEEKKTYVLVPLAPGLAQV
jgi:hypothetical protein